VALTVEATKKMSYMVVAAVLLLLALGVLVVGHPWSQVGRSGIVNLTQTGSCANPDAVTFDGSAWSADATPTILPAAWGDGAKRGRFTIRTPNTAEFISDGDHFSITFERVRKGQFSSLPCLVR